MPIAHKTSIAKPKKLGGDCRHCLRETAAS